ncbi:MAG: FecR domain-containing protein [Balneolaceae bacterium]
MKPIDETIWIVLTRSLSGEATLREEETLQDWISESEENRALYRQIRSTWSQAPSPTSDAPFLYDYKRGLNRLQEKISESEQKRSDRHQRWITRRNRRIRRYALSIAAAILVVVLTSVSYVTHQYYEEPLLFSYATNDFEQRLITLPDGSVVRLNSGSRLEVDADYIDGSREVRLTGEAYFDVEGNPEQPFLISVGDAIVHVIGTEFNVKAGEEVMVAVTEGVVSFRHQELDHRSAALLTPGHLGVLSSSGQDVRIEETPVENYVSWMNGYLRFEQMPFEQVLSQLERIYDVKYDVNVNEIANLRLTAYTEQMQLEEVHKTIALALDLTYHSADGTVQWRLNESEEALK